MTFAEKIHQFCQENKLPWKVNQAIQADSDDTDETIEFLIGQNVLASQGLINSIPIPTRAELKSLSGALNCNEQSYTVGCLYCLPGGKCHILHALLDVLVTRQAAS